MNKIPFLQMFFEYRPPKELEEIFVQAQVCHAEIRQEERQIGLTVEFPMYVPGAVLQQTEKKLAGLYGLRAVEIVGRFPGEALQSFDGADLCRMLTGLYSPCAAILAGSKWSFGEETTVTLLANGKDELLPLLPQAERYIFEHFGVQTKITVVSNHGNFSEDLFAETERMRMEAVKNMPAPKFADASPTQGAKKAAPVPEEGMIYGKPFYGNAVPMKEINIDRQDERVIIEGKVFAVEHRQNRQGTATIISFDMTDYTGSVHVGGYFKGDTGKPIADSIKKPGMWIRVQGKIDYDDYTKELVLRPFAIQPAEAPKREDKAEHKRVELHLHTNMSMMDALTKTGDVVATAARWGHQAIAITDHGVASSFPAALKASKNKVAGTDKPI